MAAERGRADTPLARELFDEAHAFEFFQAVRLLERLHPEREPLGRGNDPAREVVRLRTRASLGFPPSEIYGLERAGAGADAQPEMTVAFMGMTGPLGVLPVHYTEVLMERARYKDTALWAFLDIFSHRLISHFYRAWEKHRFPVAYERGGPDRFTDYLLSVVGLGTRALRDRLAVPDQAVLLYGGLVAQRPHSASALRAVISDYFGVPVEVEQFSGQWLRLEEENLTRLGAQNSRLGVDTVAGTRVWDAQSKFRLRVGPLGYDEFAAFTPAGSAHGPLVELTRFLVGMEFDFDIRLVFKAREVPAAIPNTRARRRPRLGWTTWLKSRPFREDDDQVVLAAKG